MKWFKNLFKKKQYPAVNMAIGDPLPEHTKHWDINDLWVNIEVNKVYILTKRKEWHLIGNTNLKSFYYMYGYDIFNSKNLKENT